MKHTITFTIDDETHMAELVFPDGRRFSFADYVVKEEREPVEDHSATYGYRIMKPGPIIKLGIEGRIEPEDSP